MWLEPASQDGDGDEDDSIGGLSWLPETRMDLRSQHMVATDIAPRDVA